MAKKMFARGYEASREEKERQDKARENMGKRLFKFFIQADSKGNAVEADLRFLTEEPVNFYEHNIKRGDNKFDTYTCTGDKDCPFCAEGDRPTYKGAYLVIDRREFDYTDKNGKKQKGKDQIRLFVMGMKIVSQLDRISSKYGLSNREVTLVRLGSGTQTTYTIEKGEKGTITSKEIKQLLPEKLRDEYDGTVDSLMAIIEEQLLMMTKDYDGGEDEDEDDDDTSEKRISYDEEEEKLPFGDDEEEKPKKTMFKKGNTKPRASKLMRRNG